MSSTEERHDRLSQMKQGLLQKWKRGELAGAFEMQKTIPRRSASGPAPLSFAQQRLWFIDQLIPNSPVYHFSVAILLVGSLHLAAFHESLNEIASRHEILRTSFPLEDGIASQAVAPVSPLALPVVDLRELSADERETLAGHLAREEARQPFDLARGPLIHLRLLRLAEDRHIFLLVMHHTICDGWSFNVFLKELGALYDASLKGMPSPLPELPFQYADFAAWQREWLQGKVLQAHLTYWKEQLDGASTILQLPTDRPRPALQTFRGNSLNFELSQPLSQALLALSQREQVTLFTTLLAAFNVLLYHYSGQIDIIVGTPIANRQPVETEKLIGFFASTLVLRTLLSGRSRFNELLGQVHRTMVRAYAHQDLPFEYLVEALHLERDTSRNPLFQVMFNFGNLPRHDLELSGLTFSFSPISTGTAMFDLWLSMSQKRDGTIRGTLEYNSDIFAEATADRLLKHFQVLLAGIAADPTRRVADLPLLSTAEQEQMLVTWNTTQRPYPLEQSLPQMIERQAECTPDAIAVSFEEAQLTYQEMNRRANQLAHALQTSGVGPDVLVGVCMERSLELVVALLAILKAGGAYVPLDPTYPRQRLAFLLEDAQVAVLITQRELRERLPEQQAKVLDLEANWQDFSREQMTNPVSALRPDHLAYVIYTSGSTGQPKGAMNRHRSICNRLLWMQETYQLRQDDRVLHKTSFSFDVSVWELFWPLLAGACLVVARPEGQRDSRYLVETIREQQITTIHFVPSMLHLLLEEPDLEDCTSLRRVICSGEALDRESLRQWFARMSADLSNLYGPTEAAVDVTWWVGERKSQQAEVPIGRPIANTQIYLLNEELRPVPVGVAGEIYIGGVSLARGYLRRVALTAERFIPNPFSNQAGERLYRTGDLARYLPDGMLEFLGRIDDQVKLHGLRIELGEIEAILRQHLDVQDAVVLVREDRPADKRLVAYVVLRRAEQPAREEQSASAPDSDQQIRQRVQAAREHLKRMLPEHMIPAIILPLDALPLTTSGKIDRRVLPAPDLSRLAPSATFVAPRNSLEERLAVLWQQVFGLDRVGVTDNFFDVGGDSIRSIQIVSRANKAGLSLNPRLLFQYQTIAELAAAAEVVAPAASADADGQTPTSQAEGGGSANAAPGGVAWRELGERLHIDPAQIVDAYPLTPMQQTMLFHHHQNHGLYLLCEVFSMKNAHFNVQAFEQGWQQVVDRHPVTRSVFVWEGLDEPLQVVLKQATLKVIHYDWRGLSPDEQEAQREAYLHDLRRRGNQLSHVPQLYMTIAQRTDEDYYWFFGFNYMLMDGWSSSLRFRDFAAFYEALCRGQTCQLEPPPAYRDHITWLRQQDLARAERFWQTYLRGFTGSLPLVGQLLPDAPHAGDPSVKEVLALARETSTALQTFAREQRLTIATLFNGAWALIMSLASGQEDVVFGHLSSGRSPELPASEYMVGFFNNILPLRVQVPPEARVVAWLQQLQAQMMEFREYEYSSLFQIKQWIGVPATTFLFDSYVVFENFPRYGYKGVGAKMLQDFGTRSFDIRHSFAPTEYPFRIECSWLFQELTMTVSGYQCYCTIDRASRLLQQLKTAFQGIMAHSNGQVGELLRLIESES